VIKVVWGTGWDDLLARDSSGLLIKRMHECVDGEYQPSGPWTGLYPQGVFSASIPSCSSWWST